MKVLVLAVATTMAMLPTVVRGHGLMTVPASRNIDHSCGHCLSSGGPAAVHADGGYVHGMCGNPASDSNQNWNAASASVTAIGTSGDSFPVEIVVTAHHHGFFEFELCDSPNITEECFRSHRLLRTGCDPEEDGDRVCRRWWKPLNSNELGHYSLEPQGYPDGAPYTESDSCNRVAYKTYYDIPDDVSCTHCVLRWHYHTSNSCTSPTSTSEEFWNCADISIAAPAGQITVDTSVDDLDALNAELTSRVPINLIDRKTDDDFWECPNPAYGKAGEYFCSVDGSDSDDTSGCVAYTAGETCTIQHYVNNDMESVGTPLWSYCTWDHCLANDNPKSEQWCDASEERCSNCGGTWCQGYDGEVPTTTAWATTTYDDGDATTTYAAPSTTATDQAPPTAATTTVYLSTTSAVEPTTTEAMFTTTSTEEAPSSGSGFCAWYDCSAGSVNSVWCDSSQDNCEGPCNGKWCPDVQDLPDFEDGTSTTDFATTTALDTTTMADTTTDLQTTTELATTTELETTTETQTTTATEALDYDDEQVTDEQVTAIASLAAKVDALTVLVEDLIQQFASSSCVPNN